MFCNKCGAEIPDDSSFCLKCGNPIPGTSSDGSSSNKIKPTEKSSSSGTKNKSVFKIIISVATSVAAILVILAFLGVFDKPAYESGLYGKPDNYETVIVNSEGNNQVEDSKVKFSDLSDYINQSESEIISLFGFTESETHIYPDDDHIMFWFDQGKVYSLRLSDKTKDMYPDAAIYGIKIGDAKEVVEKTTSEKNLTLLDDSAGNRVAYADSSNQVLMVEYNESNKVTSVQYMADPTYIEGFADSVNSNTNLENRNVESDIDEEGKTQEIQSSNTELKDGRYYFDNKDLIYNIIDISGNKIELEGYTYYLYRWEGFFSGVLEKDEYGNYTSTEDWGDGIYLNVYLYNISEKGFDLEYEYIQGDKEDEYYRERNSGHYSLLEGEIPEEFAECFEY